MTFLNVVFEKREEHIFVVGTFGYFLAKVNVSMLWSLSAEIFCPTKHDDVLNLLKDTMSQNVFNEGLEISTC